ncbi:hypothetical protein ACFYN3_01715 [Streptomyces lavendulae]|uniref:hypothetical protein n=1 Tax=Streptomyces lavendulae TaxID=1914 RepID=UPI0033CDE5CB
MQSQQRKVDSEEPVYGAYSFMDGSFAVLSKAFFRIALEDSFACLDYQVFGVLYRLQDHREPNHLIVISQREIIEEVSAYKRTKVDQSQVSKSLKKLKNAKMVHSVRQAKMRLNPEIVYSGKAKGHGPAIDSFRMLITPEPMKVVA